MDTIFEQVYDVLFHPRAALQKIAERRPIGQALIIFLISVIIPMWAVYFGVKASGLPQAPGVMLVLELFGSLLFWLLGTAVWHLIAELFGGRGTALGLLAALGFAHFPRVLLVPLWVLSSLMPPGISAFLVTGSFLVILVWSLWLDVYAIKGTYQVSGAKAVLILLTPLLAGVAGMFIIMILLASAVIPWPPNL
ncbi:Yip1 family protein [Propionispora hippei]|uniref:Yip1 domain-containing protein n=1 Tax=Propionispora hippei DSM 15287 TaxID=1123003 RepID=A0A1M6J9Y2_9FIRM|nr:Yip1 family protein [Propionispora hippei]SHJ43489.1 Yip1 domain-containing protein [Propionispora hippei DSM 15287]